MISLKGGNGQWCEDVSKLKQMAREFFQNLYQDVGEVTDPALSLNFPRGSLLSETQLLTILRPVSEEEIRKVIFAMSLYKAPGGDGLQAKFFQADWSIVGKSVCDFILAAFRDGKFDRRINETLLCIIPKVDHPEVINQFRPISLCNVVVKTISKIMVSRLRPHLTDLVSPTQSSFIPGRGCHDNIIVVQEAIHSFKKIKSKSGFFMMKVDLEKAYDRLNWDFLRWVLMDIGLPTNWISLIMFSVTNSDFSLLWNGKKLDPFTPAQGVRQGDPLSPYLFALCLERFSQIIENAVTDKRWIPFNITRHMLALSHVFFTDDLILFGSATAENIMYIMECLNMFCRFSGQRVNSNKSKLYFSANTQPNNIADVCRISNMEATNDLGKHLGVTLHTQRVTKTTFHDLISRMKARLSQWKASQLSLAGRHILVQSVTSTLANHAMQCVKIPAGVCDAIDQVQRNFLWGGTNENRKPALVKWSTVCTPKKPGRTGHPRFTFDGQSTSR